MTLRTLAEIEAAGAALAAGWPPPGQALVNRAAILLAPYQPRIRAAQAASHAA